MKITYEDGRIVKHYWIEASVLIAISIWLISLVK